MNDKNNPANVYLMTPDSFEEMRPLANTSINYILGWFDIIRDTVSYEQDIKLILRYSSSLYMFIEFVEQQNSIYIVSA